MEKAASGPENRLFFYAFNDPEPMIRVDDLVADLECHVSLLAGW
jgi:hypothetical protein